MNLTATVLATRGKPHHDVWISAASHPSRVGVHLTMQPCMVWDPKQGHSQPPTSVNASVRPKILMWCHPVDHCKVQTCLPIRVWPYWYGNQPAVHISQKINKRFPENMEIATWTNVSWLPSKLIFERCWSYCSLMFTCFKPLSSPEVYSRSWLVSNFFFFFFFF